MTLYVLFMPVRMSIPAKLVHNYKDDSLTLNSTKLNVFPIAMHPALPIPYPIPLHLCMCWQQPNLSNHMICWASSSPLFETHKQSHQTSTWTYPPEFCDATPQASPHYSTANLSVWDPHHSTMIDVLPGICPEVCMPAVSLPKAGDPIVILF